MGELIEKTAIQIHLTLKDQISPTGKKIQSCMTAALNEARYITGRNTTTGLPDPTNEHGYLGRWSGAMCYMTILDQIGTCYRPKTKERMTKGSAIEKALNYFTSLTEDEICALYALRNAFFHDFSLLNIYPSKPKMQHAFTVDNHETNPIVVLPKEQWDGQMNSRNADRATYVNLRALGDLVENVYKLLLDLESKGELIVELSGGDSELLNRYSFSH